MKKNLASTIPNFPNSISNVNICIYNNESNQIQNDEYKSI